MAMKPSLTKALIVAYLGMHFNGIQDLYASETSQSASGNGTINQLYKGKGNLTYETYLMLKSDKRLLKQFQELKFEQLDPLGWANLSDVHKQQLLNAALRVDPSRYANLLPTSTQKAKQQIKTSDPVESALGLTTLSVSNLPTLEVEQQLSNGLNLTNPFKNIVSPPNQGSAQVCRKTEYESTSCTQPIVSVNDCIAETRIEGTDHGTGTLDAEPKVTDSDNQLWEQLSAEDYCEDSENSCFVYGSWLEADGSSLSISATFHDLPKSRLAKVTIATYEPTDFQEPGVKTSEDTEVDITKHLRWSSNGKVAYFVATAHFFPRDGESVFFRIYTTQDVKASTVNYGLERCPLVAIKKDFKKVAKLNSITKAKVETRFELTSAGVRPEIQGEEQPSNPLREWTTECMDELVDLSANKCVTENGKQFCNIQNPSNPYFEDRKVYCKTVKISWQYLTNIPSNCYSKISQTLTAETIKRANDRSQRFCSLQGSVPIYAYSNIYADAKSPYSAQYSRTNEATDQDEVVQSIVGFRHSYKCTLSTSNPECINKFISARDFLDCPEEFSFEVENKSYTLEKIDVCNMKSDCPAFLTYSGVVKEVTVGPDLKDDSITQGKPSVGTAEFNQLAEDPSSVSSHYDAFNMNSGLNGNRNIVAAGDTYSQPKLHTSAMREVISTNDSCSVIQQLDNSITYKCKSTEQYEDAVVTKSVKCPSLTCQSGDVGCEKLDNSKRSMTDVLARTALLQHIRQDITCDEESGECYVFPGQATGCRCTLDGLVNCCSVEQQAVGLSEYLELLVSSTTLVDSVSYLSGYGRPIEALTSSVGETVSNAASSVWETLKKPITSVFSSAGGDSLNKAVSQSTQVATEVSKTYMEKLYEWTVDVAGEKFGNKIFDTSGEVIKLSPAITNIAAGITAAYSAWKVVRTGVEIAAECRADEASLARRKQLKVCHVVGVACSYRVLGKCVQTTEMTCCFSTPLSRILQEQVRKQLNIGWGTPDSPDCRPLSTAQLQQVDWSKIDLSEYVSIMLNSPTFRELPQKLAEQKVQLARHPEFNANKLIDHRNAKERNADRLKDLQKVSLQNFFEQARSMLIED